MSNYNEVHSTGFAKRNRGGKGSSRGGRARGGARGGFRDNNYNNNSKGSYRRDDTYNYNNSSYGEDEEEGMYNPSTYNYASEQQRSPPSTINQTNTLHQQTLQPTSYSDISRRDHRDDNPAYPAPVYSPPQPKTRTNIQSNIQANVHTNGQPVDTAPTQTDQAPDQNANPQEQVNPEYPPEFFNFVDRKLQKINTLKPEKQVIAKTQLQSIITLAKDEDLFWTNDWTKQLVPLIDGGGQLILHCKKTKHKKSSGGELSPSSGSSSSIVSNANKPAKINANMIPMAGHSVYVRPPRKSHRVIEDEEDEDMDGNSTNGFGNHHPTNTTVGVDSNLQSSRSSTLPPSTSAHARHLNDNDDLFIDNSAADLSYNSNNFGQAPPPPTATNPTYQGQINEERQAQVMSYSSINNKRDADDYISDERKRQRLERFENNSGPTTPTDSNSSSSTKNGPLVGRNTKLEKSYLRLTSEPDPNNVRPQNILEQSIEFVLKKSKTMDIKDSYTYLINQLKSIRQDLTVQHLKNDFTIKVYEINAKESIKAGDLGEFNQCQTQLKHLYNLARSSKGSKREFIGSEVELIAYKIIYMMITRNNSEISKLRLSILEDYKGFAKRTSDLIFFEFINSLFKFNEYLLSNNSYKFFQDILNFKKFQEIELALKMISKFLYDKIRIGGLFTICSSYKTVDINFLQNFLGFETKSECDGFLKNYKLHTFMKQNNFSSISAKGKVGEIFKKMSKVDIKGQI
ncbi:hypothetical protein KGF54_004325 [Candida jiufengensis]|uniref:uncharacterized protein n=1 Tax=Candida jiufengensis TaxID=497108 RepID=UPI00222588F4|nr:uncharacterized protein KGF54_004325 [Candida jiufengensis]KAI5951251.1 hypothetical protein KGF54_004325 [Candida jiufengensis]